MGEAVRLNKYLSAAGLCSRREADKLIAEGRVTVNGELAENGMKVDENSVVCLDGKRVAGKEKPVFLAVHKPVGVVCTSDDRWGDTRLEDLVKCQERVFYVGRLDKNSRGLILMTNQGDLSNRMMRSVNYHEKEYEVSVDKVITPGFLKKMREGIYLEELQIKTRSCRVEKIDEKRFRIILTQGLNRQIRRMCHACGYEVTDLLRVRVLNIYLNDLKEGTYRELTQEEVQGLQALTQDSRDFSRERNARKQIYSV